MIKLLLVTAVTLHISEKTNWNETFSLHKMHSAVLLFALWSLKQVHKADMATAPHHTVDSDTLAVDSDTLAAAHVTRAAAVLGSLYGMSCSETRGIVNGCKIVSESYFCTLIYPIL